MKLIIITIILIFLNCGSTMAQGMYDNFSDGIIHKSLYKRIKSCTNYRFFVNDLDCLVYDFESYGEYDSLGRVTYIFTSTGDEFIYDYYPTGDSVLGYGCWSSNTDYVYRYNKINDRKSEMKWSDLFTSRKLIIKKRKNGNIYRIEEYAFDNSEIDILWIFKKKRRLMFMDNGRKKVEELRYDDSLLVYKWTLEPNSFTECINYEYSDQRRLLKCDCFSYSTDKDSSMCSYSERYTYGNNYLYSEELIRDAPETIEVVLLDDFENRIKSFNMTKEKTILNGRLSNIQYYD